MKFRLEQTIKAFSQLINSLMFGGWADETIGSRAYRYAPNFKRWALLMTILNIFDKKHCERCYICGLGLNGFRAENRDNNGLDFEKEDEE